MNRYDVFVDDRKVYSAYTFGDALVAVGLYGDTFPDSEIKLLLNREESDKK